MRLQVDGLEGDEAIGKAQATVGNCVVAAVLLKTWFRGRPCMIKKKRCHCQMLSFRKMPKVLVSKKNAENSRFFSEQARDHPTGVPFFLSIFSKKREALCAVAVQQLATGAGL